MSIDENTHEKLNSKDEAKSIYLGLFIKMAIVLFIPFVLYVISSILQNENLSNIFSAVTALVAALILMYVYNKSDHSIKVSIAFLVCALGAFAWGIADTIWSVIYFLGGNPEENIPLTIIYFLTNVFLLASILVFVITYCKRWYLAQILVDVSINTYLFFVLFWFVFLHKDFSLIIKFIKADFTSILSIFTDIVIQILLYTWYLSIRSGKTPMFLRIISTGMLLFTYTDIAYYYLFFNNMYSPNTLIDVLYISSLALIAFGGLWKIYINNSVLEYNLKNIGGKITWVYLLIYPVIIILFSFKGFSDVSLTFSDILLSTVPIFLYVASCKYIRVSSEKESTLKESNMLLEKQVAEHVKELTLLTKYDTLTPLYNRRYFITLLEGALSQKVNKDNVSIFLMNIDRFKTINNTFGHDIGDKALIDFSNRIIEWNKYEASIARLGGDEFAVLLLGQFERKDLESIGQEIIELCSKPLYIGENSVTVTLSIGIAIADVDCSDGKTLVQNADIAMQRAKAQGYNGFQVYDSFMSQDLKKINEIEMLLSQADVSKEFELFFQPQYALPSVELIGAEALLRWNNPKHGYIPPNVFIPIAEQNDFILKIGRWVIKETIEQSKRWNNQYPKPLKIGFNISPNQFKETNFTETVKTMISDSKIKPQWIDAEITESTMIKDYDNIQGIFNMFHELDVTVSIDDFGSGYSALGYLNKYNFDRIKIDKSLIDNISAKNDSGANIVMAAINMAHAIGIRAIAEGVETEDQLNILIELGCDQVQGYFLGRPVPPDVFEERYIKPLCTRKIT